MLHYMIVKKWQISGAIPRYDCEAHRAPRSTVKLFASSEINNLLEGIDKAAPLAVDDYKLITKILINQKN
jgi:hypothetical protein